jgi:hypothetical protein
VVDLPKREGHVKKANQDEEELLSFAGSANKHDKLLVINKICSFSKL